MTEQEYINVSDLARVRAAKSILRAMLCYRDTDEVLLANATSALSNLEDSLRDRVHIEFHVKHDQEPSK